MDNSISSISFGRTYYSKLLLSRIALPHETSLNNKKIFDEIINSASLVHDKQPPEFLKKIVGQSKFFQDLDDKTDVFVASQLKLIEKDIKTPWFGVITAAFKDPYSVVEKSPEVLLIDARAETENQLKQMLADYALKLPLFKNLTCKKSHFAIFEKNPESGDGLDFISQGFGVKIIDNGERLGMFDRGQII